MSDRYIILHGRYRFVSYTDLDSSGLSENDSQRVISLKDLETGEEIQLVDFNRDGLDKIIVNKKTSYHISDAYRKLYKDAVDQAKRSLKFYTKELSDYIRPQVVEDINSESFTIYAKKQEDDSFHRELIVCPKSTTKYVFASATNNLTTAQAFSQSDLLIADRWHQVKFLMSASVLEEGFFAATTNYLAPLLRIADFSDISSGSNAYDTISGGWLLFLNSREFNLIDGNEKGVASDVEFEMAKLARQTIEEQDVMRLGDESALVVLRRYSGPADLIEFSAFLEREKSAAHQITSRLNGYLNRVGWFDLFTGERIAEVPLVHVDSSGHIILNNNRSRPTPNIYVNNYIIDAFGCLVHERSGGRLRLRDRTLQYLNNCIVTKGDELFFVDSEQNDGEPLKLSHKHIIEMLVGRARFLRKGVLIGNYYLRDQNGDNVITAKDDVAQLMGGSQYYMDEMMFISVESAVTEVSKEHPAPFDQRLFFSDGVSMDLLERWAALAPSELSPESMISQNPLKDGEYRVLIFRPNTMHKVELDTFWLSAFVALNNFDDVYVVSPHQGIELALNEVAKRGLLIDTLYIGTHGDWEAEAHKVVFDAGYDLKFNHGGAAILTGCDATRDMAMALGAKIFRKSQGELIWGDGLNIVLPNGDFFTLYGKEHNYYFRRGRLIGTKGHSPMMDVSSFW